MNRFTIGKLSSQTGCKIPTIRYYEEEALLQEPYRTEGNQRRYSVDHLKRLNFIMHARELGFTLDQIRELIALANSDQIGHEADLIAKKHLQMVEQKIKRLQSLSEELKHMLHECSYPKKSPCRVIEALFDHSLCLNDH